MTRNRSIVRNGLTLALLIAALTGCAGTAKTANNGMQTQASGLSGKVVETMDAGGYTYICLEKEGKKTWVAAPTMKVTVGQDLQLLTGAEMTQFESKTLNRTFDKIIFSGGLVPAAADAKGAAPAADAVSQEPILSGKVVETMNAQAYTYIRLEKDGKSAWSAVPNTGVEVGDVIELQPGTAMGKFVSKTMNRTFDAIYFSSGVKEQVGKKPDATVAPAAAASGLPSGHPALGQAAGSAAAASGLPAGHPALGAAAGSAPAAAPAASPITGKVVETMNAGGYTYICLENKGTKTWAAVPPMEVKVGDQLALAPGNVMSNFASKSLNRTFETIIFSGGPASK